MTSFLAALSVGGLLVGCGHATETRRASVPTTSSQAESSTAGSAAPPAASYDISHVGEVKNTFPPGFQVAAFPARPLSQQDIESSRLAAVAKGRIVPPKCRVVVIPPYAQPSVGTEAAGVSGGSEHGRIDVVALRSAKPVPAGEKPTGCGLGLTISGAPDIAGPAEQIQPPDIAGATTTGIKLNPEQMNPEYIFTAALDDRTAVVVVGNTDAQLNPAQLMSDLLVKAAAAVRGR